MLPALLWVLGASPSVGLEPIDPEYEEKAARAAALDASLDQSIAEFDKAYEAVRYDEARPNFLDLAKPMPDAKGLFDLDAKVALAFRVGEASGLWAEAYVQKAKRREVRVRAEELAALIGEAVYIRVTTKDRIGPKFPNLPCEMYQPMVSHVARELGRERPKESSANIRVPGKIDGAYVAQANDIYTCTKDRPPTADRLSDPQAVQLSLLSKVYYKNDALSRRGSAPLVSNDVAMRMGSRLGGLRDKLLREGTHGDGGLLQPVAADMLSFEPGREHPQYAGSGAVWAAPSGGGSEPKGFESARARPPGPNTLRTTAPPPISPVGSKTASASVKPLSAVGGKAAIGMGAIRNLAGRATEEVLAFPVRVLGFLVGASAPRAKPSVAEGKPSSPPAAKGEIDRNALNALAHQAVAVGMRTGKTVLGFCLRAVKGMLQWAGIMNAGDIQLSSAYQFKDFADRHPGLRGRKFVKVDHLKRPLQIGSIIVWGRGVCGYHPEHGHIEIVVAQHRVWEKDRTKGGIATGQWACSDHCERIRIECMDTLGSDQVSVYVIARQEEKPR